MSTVNKFGHYLGREGKIGPPGLGFMLNDEGNYDMQNRTLSNVKESTKDRDVVTYSLLKRRLSSTVQFDMKKAAFTCQSYRVSDLRPPEKDADAVNLSFLTHNTLNCYKNDHFNTNNKRLKGLPMPTEPSEAVNRQFLLDAVQKIHENTICSDKDYYDAKNKRLHGLGKPVEPSDAVSIEYLDETVKKSQDNTLHLEQNKFDAKGIVIENLGQGEAKTDAVNLSLLKSMLKVQAYYAQRDLADAVIELRREIHDLHAEKHTVNEIANHLNSLEDSYKNTWRAVLQSKKPSKTDYTEFERKQIIDLIKVQKPHLDFYLENE